jgi:hypothetical protein
MMRTRWLNLTMLAAGAVSIVGGTRAAAAANPPPAVDPAAVAALDRMSTFLRGLRDFAIVAESSTDEVLDSGQKIKRNGVTQLKVRRPNGLRAEVRMDDDTEHYYYDGKTFTIFGPSTGYYASFAAPPTLGQLADLAERRYGVDLPLADLFAWGTDKNPASGLKGATSLGPSMVRGIACDHFAFREADVDWQVWIEHGENPLPRKMVITTTTERAQPEHQVLLSWDLAPKLENGMFAFVPPPDAHKIDFEVARAAGASATSPRQGRAAPAHKGGKP